MRNALFALCLVILPGSCLADGRVALVLGIRDYDHISNLANPVADATAVAGLLETLGFEVILETNRDARRTRRALEDFALDAEGADLALVYYAGHGVEIEGKNYLLPSDADVSDIDTLSGGAIALSDVVSILTAASPSAILLVDACRNDPFAGTPLEADGRGAVALAGQSAPRLSPGFARVGRADGLVYAFAATPGETASDGSGGHSPFAEALLRHLGTPGLELRSVLTLVTQDVYDRSRGAQLPYVESALPELVFVAAPAGQLSERETLLLAMAGLTPDLRAEVETLAGARDMPLAPLYAAVFSADLARASLDDRKRALTEAADAYAAFQDNLRTLAEADPRVATLRDAAKEDMDLGAYAGALGKLDEAAAVDAAARDTLKGSYVARTVSQAETLILQADAARAALTYPTAITALGNAAALLAEVEALGISRDAMKARTNALWDLGDLLALTGDSGAAMQRYLEWNAVAQGRVAQTPDDKDWQRNLAVSHNKIGDIDSAQGDLAGAEAAYTAALAIAMALASGDPDNTTWQRDLSISYNRLGGIQQAKGDLAAAETAYAAALTINQALALRDPANSDWQSDLAVSNSSIGDIKLTKGDLAGAEQAQSTALAIRKALVARDPLNANWQRDLSISYNRLGDIHLAQGDLAKAEAAQTAALAISQAFATRDPDNSDWQRDLSVNHNKLGDLRLAFGDLAGAEAAYSASLTIRQALAARDPLNSIWQRDLSVSYSGLGDIRRARGDLAGAEAAYSASLAISQTLAAREPGNSEWQRSLAIDFSRLGDLRLANGDPAGAETAYASDLAITRNLAARDPLNTEWQRDLAVSYYKMGDIRRAQDDLAGAKTAYDSALAIARALAARDPDNSDWQRDLSVGHERIGNVLRAQGDLAGAEAAYAAGLDIRQALAARDPLNSEWQRDLSVTYNNFGDLRIALGDLDGARTAFASALSISQALAALRSGNVEAELDMVICHFKLATVSADPHPHLQSALDILRKLQGEGRLPPRNVEWIAIIEGAIADLPQ